MSKKCETLTTFNITVLLLVLTCFFLLTWILINQVKDYYSQHNPYLKEVVSIIKNKMTDPEILKALNSVTFHEGEDSYTINKKKTYVCLTDENGEYYSHHTLTYVILHEMAHVLCDEIGHTEKFHKIFKQILKKAEECGLHDPNKSIPNNYAKAEGSCGVSGAKKKEHNTKKYLN